MAVSRTRIGGNGRRSEKHHSPKDVAAAGRWKDVETLLTCCEQADAGTMLAVVTEATKLREVV